MREAVAVKIAEHLAAIAAPARVKRALDRYIEKKAISLTDRPMAYGAGLGALGGGALMGGSTALANMFRKKEDKKSVLDNALLGAAGGGALGLSGGALYHGLYGQPAKVGPATPEEIKNRLEDPLHDAKAAAAKLKWQNLSTRAAAMEGSHIPGDPNFNPLKQQAYNEANEAGKISNLYNETTNQRKNLTLARDPLTGYMDAPTAGASGIGGLAGLFAGWYGGKGIDIKDSLVKAFEEGRGAGEKGTFWDKLKSIMGEDIHDSRKRDAIFGAVAGQQRREEFPGSKKLYSLMHSLTGNVPGAPQLYGFVNNMRQRIGLSPINVPKNFQEGWAERLVDKDKFAPNWKPTVDAANLNRTTDEIIAHNKLEAEREAAKLKADAAAAASKTPHGSPTFDKLVQDMETARLNAEAAKNAPKPTHLHGTPNWEAANRARTDAINQAQAEYAKLQKMHDAEIKTHARSHADAISKTQTEHARLQKIFDDAVAAQTTKYNARVREIADMPNRFSASELTDIAKPKRGTASRWTRSLGLGTAGALAAPFANWMQGTDTTDLETKTMTGAGRTADDVRKLRQE